MLPTLSGSFKSILVFRQRYLETILNKSFSTIFFSCPLATERYNLCSSNNNNNLYRHKIKLISSLKIWEVIYPSITLLLYLFGTELSVLPLYQRTLLLTIVLVQWMVFVGLPLLGLIHWIVFLYKRLKINL